MNSICSNIFNKEKYCTHNSYVIWVIRWLCEMMVLLNIRPFRLMSWGWSGSWTFSELCRCSLFLFLLTVFFLPASLTELFPTLSSPSWALSHEGSKSVLIHMADVMMSQCYIINLIWPWDNISKGKQSQLKWKVMNAQNCCRSEWVKMSSFLEQPQSYPNHRGGAFFAIVLTFSEKSTHFFGKLNLLCNTFQYSTHPKE